jgi:hypothetical protein
MLHLFGIQDDVMEVTEHAVDAGELLGASVEA